jgi:hypothetical protein|uniref:DUF4376 domain-containing protein n=1 Tax=Siphoviridae sp. ctTic26 TaxID=2823583 RepID=A0A8S5LEQ1_9CAUD|nr:MAG TPA: hypothetical protein [Siphoviridae sp. ctTic26]
MIIYIYDKNSLELIAQPMTLGVEKFKENPNLFFPDWNSETMTFSTSYLVNPVLDTETGELREMNEYEQIVAGKLFLTDGEYLDEKTKSVKRVAKPNEWSTWNKTTNTWKIDNSLLESKKNELKKKLLQDLADAKSNYLNQTIEIEKAGKKYTFENNEKNRNRLSLKISLMWVLDQDKIEKVKAQNEKGLVEFIELNKAELKVLAGKIQDIIQVADVSEQTAVTGLERYSIEQLMALDVNDFFKN